MLVVTNWTPPFVRTLNLYLRFKIISDKLTDNEIVRTSTSYRAGKGEQDAFPDVPFGGPLPGPMERHPM